VNSQDVGDRSWGKTLERAEAAIDQGTRAQSDLRFLKGVVKQALKAQSLGESNAILRVAIEELDHEAGK